MGEGAEPWDAPTSSSWAFRTSFSRLVYTLARPEDRAAGAHYILGFLGRRESVAFRPRFGGSIPKMLW